MSGVLGNWCTRDQAARILQVSPSRVSQLVKSGRLGYVVVGRRTFPSLQAVYALAAYKAHRLDLMDGEAECGN